jgi:predicted lipid-binding transport protein (Tim44 family)
MVPLAPPARRVAGGSGLLAAVAAGWLIASALSGGFGLESRGLGLLHQVLLGGAIFVFVTMLGRRWAARAQPARRTVAVPSGVAGPPPPPAVTTGDRPSGDSSLDEGVRDIRQTDPKFDPARFTGYIEMVFRDTHAARTSRDIASLLDRVTPELYGELQAQCDRVRSLGHASHVEQIEIRAQVTEAWHEQGRDYVTAYITGAMLDYTLDELTGALTDGSKTILVNVQTFWTFTRPAGLNPWMLSAIQTS